MQLAIWVCFVSAYVHTFELNGKIVGGSEPKEKKMSRNPWKQGNRETGIQTYSEHEKINQNFVLVWISGTVCVPIFFYRTAWKTKTMKRKQSTWQTQTFAWYIKYTLGIHRALISAAFHCLFVWVVYFIFCLDFFLMWYIFSENFWLTHTHRTQLKTETEWKIHKSFQTDVNWGLSCCFCWKAHIHCDEEFGK